MLEPLIRIAQVNPPMRPTPINPAWIEAGDPIATSALLAATDDRGGCVMFWHCTAGRFTWHYNEDETVHILDGGVTIVAEGLPSRFYGPGETIHFSRGAVATWEIETMIRKVAFCRSVLPRPFIEGRRILRSVYHRLRGRSDALSATPAFG